MRPKTSADSTKARRNRPELTHFPDASTSAAWQARAIRDAILVRRLCRVAALGGAGVLGQTHTIDALAHGTITELLLTPRFVESNPSLALTVAQIAAVYGARTTRVAGLAAFELDLAAGGIGAMLSRARPRRPRSVA